MQTLILRAPLFVLGGATLIACGNGKDGSSVVNNKSIEFSQTIVNLAVTSSVGNVTLLGSDTRVTTITYPDVGYEALQFDNALSGRLSIGTVCEDGTLGCGVDMTIETPATTQFEINTESGDVDIQGMSLLGTVDSTLGQITASDLGAMDLRAETRGGNLDIAFRLVPVEVFLGGGDDGMVTLDLPRGSNGRYNFDVQTQGSITFTGGLQDSASGPPITVVSVQGDVLINGF